MAGNAQEWAWNETDGGFRFILGGAWSSPTYQFGSHPDAKPPFDRGAANGFRCALYPTPLHEGRCSRRSPAVAATTSIEKPVGDEAFQVIRSVYAYTARELKATTDQVDNSSPLLEEGKGQLLGRLRGRTYAAFVFLQRTPSPPIRHWSITLVPEPSPVNSRAWKGSTAWNSSFGAAVR